MLRRLTLLLLATAWHSPAAPPVTLATNGVATALIVLDPAATPAERTAASELQSALNAITGASFALLTTTGTPPACAILVGPGLAARRLFPDLPFDDLGPEEIILRTRGQRLLLAGGRPRGTIYAVCRFLQTQCGVRWWTPWATTLPQQSVLRIPAQFHRDSPAFAYREAYYAHTLDPAWAVHNAANGHFARIPDAWGGHNTYDGFVHTFYALAPPAELFGPHPEWFALVGGQRTNANAQLCLTHPALRNHITTTLRKKLQSAPQTRLVSLSQNDCHGWCECTDCTRLSRREGGPSGPLMAFVNDIATRLAREFPQVTFDTLAYQKTRPPPRTLRPARNVVVRLCTIEADFRQPLSSAANRGIARDLQVWSRRARRLFVWDYVTNFRHYLLPHPNVRHLGANLRQFRDHHVTGVFEQGNYSSFGGEFAELRAWVLAQLMWNPDQNERALTLEFLRGYYGPAAPFVRRYLDLMHHASADVRLGCFTDTNTAFLRFATLSRAETLWRQAAAAVAGDPELSSRVALGHLPVRYAFLARWPALQAECRRDGGTWPFPDGRQPVADAFLKTCAGDPARPWTLVGAVSENGQSPEDFIAALPPESVNQR